MSRKDFDTKLRTRIKPYITKELKRLNSSSVKMNLSIMFLGLFDQCVRSVRAQWEVAQSFKNMESWLGKTSVAKFDVSIRRQLRLYVKYMCHCPDKLAAKLVEDIISRL